MIPELFRIGSFAVSPYGVMMVVAFVAAYFQLRWGFARLGAGDEEDASTVVFTAGVAGIAGAKVYYAALQGDWRLLFSRSGLVWYGGFLAAFAAVLWLVRRRRLPVWPVLDAATPALALGYAIGRVGCFLVGDDYGRPTDLPWGVAFPRGLPPTTAGSLRLEYGWPPPPGTPDEAVLAVHPTQLYETAAGLLVWALGVWLLRRGAASGTVALAILGLLAAERFGIEFLRLKDDRFLGDLTLAQAISLAVVAAVVVALLLRRRLRRRAGAPAAVSGSAAGG
jgi:phosphatidylglycerol:prolipoprotein diacylglycerol transferase